MKDVMQRLASLQAHHHFQRVGKLFQTRANTYFYDSGTGKVFACEGMELEVLQCLLQEDWDHLLHSIESDARYETACQQILELVEQEHILKLPIYTSFTNEYKDDYREGKLKQLVLEVTQKCNLRCRYCIYHDDFDQFRTFGQRDMSWEIAKLALDYANEHGSDDIIIGFYGGEPLLNFELMKKAIAYCLENFKAHKELYFTMTSNLTLLTKEQAAYLANVPNFNIVCSLDGPEDIQNRYRVFPNAIGSFEQTMRGLKLICEAMGEAAAQRISIHSVICPPYDDQKMNQMKQFFNDIPWLPKGVAKNIAYVGEGTLFDMPTSTLQDTNVRPTYDDPVKRWALQELSHPQGDFTYAFQIQQNALMKMHVRSILDQPAQTLFRNACCTPGIRKIYVSVDGALSACERIGNSPSLGSIQEGLQVPFIKEKYFREYDDCSLTKCNDCWALHLCSNCYALCYGSEGVNSLQKDKQCEMSRQIVENDLVAYYQLLEENPMIEQLLEQIAKTYS